jgi:hypothetical protein
MIAFTQNKQGIVKYVQANLLTQSDITLFNQYLKESLQLQAYDNMRSAIKAYCTLNDINSLDFDVIRNYIDVRQGFLSGTTRKYWWN